MNELHDKTPQQLNMIEIDAHKAIDLFSRNAGDIQEDCQVIFASEAKGLIRQVIVEILMNQHKEG